MRSAFTLIEILIVVILLGILAAIVVPMFTDAAEDTNIAACDTNVSALKTAFQLYTAHMGYPPTTLAALASEATNTANKVNGPWVEVVPGCPFGTPYTINVDGVVVCGNNHDGT